MSLPRGIRNNNPGNIRLSSIHWEGQSDHEDDPSFCVFVEPQYGLRAIMVLIRNYYNIYALNTIREIIARWAPSVENDTLSYTNAVANHLNVHPDDKINAVEEQTMLGLVQAIVLHENGAAQEAYPEFWYPQEVYEATYKELFHG